tara:strand:- start:11012 stop:11947 length:936 start_codon:yes stop_codon:yes gene_type:complete
MIEALLFLALGLILLLLGSNLLVSSTERFSNTFSISGFIASFFMIGIATSAPEIFISIESALLEQTTLAIGNAIGSNLANIALVFAVSTFAISKKGDTISLPVNAFVGMMSLTISVFLLILFDGYFNFIDSLVLIFLFIGILFALDKSSICEDSHPVKYNIKYNLFKIIFSLLIGIILLIYGSDFFIYGATQIALFFGISSYIIGLTLTALGTSLPELAASIESARKGRSDFIVGNIIGSNIFNIAIALSIAGLISGTVVDTVEYTRDIIVLFLASGVFYMIIKSDKFFIKTVYSGLLVITYLVYVFFILR